MLHNLLRSNKRILSSSSFIQQFLKMSSTSRPTTASAPCPFDGEGWITKNYLLESELTDEKINKAIKQGAKSLLVVSTGNEGDLGYVGGISALKENYGSLLNISHVPFDASKVPSVDSSKLIYKEQLPQNNIEDNNKKLLEQLIFYKKFENSLKLLPQPVLISCKTARRASVVFFTYFSLINKLTYEESLQLFKDEPLRFFGNDLLTGFVRNTTNFIANSTDSLIFYQLFDTVSSTYTYLLGSKKTKKALLIDPVLEKVERDTQLIRDLGLDLKYILNTHCHADHITGSGKLKTIFKDSKSIISQDSGAAADIKISNYDIIELDEDIKLFAVSTPGHTNGCMSFILNDLSRVFTGDALLIRGCGRTDFQEGNSSELYTSIHEKIFTLPDETIVYPAHDYNGVLSSSIFEEKNFNKRLTKSRNDFVKLMSELNLPYPKKIDSSLPANLVCGIHFEEYLKNNN